MWIAHTKKKINIKERSFVGFASIVVRSETAYENEHEYIQLTL